MSRNARLALIAATIAVAVVAFVIAKPGDDDDKDKTTTTTAAQTETTATRTTAEPPAPKVEEIVVKNGQPVGGVRKITVKKGDTVRFKVSSDDTTSEIHVHGYDFMKDMAPGKPVSFAFKANLEGGFEAELEDTSTQILSLQVEPR